MKISKNNTNGVHDISVEKFWNGLVGFTAYSFNKSHSIAYAQISYQTAKLYTYRWQEYMEYHLNYGNAEYFKSALRHLSEEGYVPTYPSYQNMSSDKYVVYSDRTRKYKDGSTLVPDRDFKETKNYEFVDHGKIREIIFPGGENRNYDSLLEALFSQTIRATAVLKGVFDFLSKDREGILDLINALTKRQADKMMYSQIDNSYNLEQILSEMKIAGIVDTYTGNRRKGFHVEIFPFRGTKNKIVEIRPDYNSDVIVNGITYDLKYFKSIRKGLLGPIPNEMEENERFWNVTFQDLERRRNKADEMYGEGWYEGDLKNRWLNFAKKLLREKLDDYKYRARSGFDPKIKEPIRAIITDIAGRGYSSGTKVTFKFSNGEDFFYVPNTLIPALKKLKKNAVVEVTFVFSPFVQYRTGDIIMDYDVLRIKDLETDKFVDTRAKIVESRADRDVEVDNPNWTDKLRILNLNN